MVRVDHKNFIYMEKQNFIFAYIPKAACTNWKSILRFISGQENWLDSKLAHDKMLSGLRYLDLETSDIEILSDDSIPKYAMVRNPYSRTLSAYLNKIDSRQGKHAKTPSNDHFSNIVMEIRRFNSIYYKSHIEENISFEQFLIWLDNPDGIRDGKQHLRLNEHWAPQIELLQLGKVNYSFVGRFENISGDAQRILDLMGCAVRFPSQSDVKFAPTNASGRLKGFYSEEAKRLVAKIFGKDFDALGYPLDLEN